MGYRCSDINRALNIKSGRSSFLYVNMYKKKINKKVFWCITLIIFLTALLFGKIFFNYSAFKVSTPSMEPEFLVNCIIISRKEPIGSLKPGDVIVFKSDALGGKLAFHRVTRIENNGVYTKGDKNKYEDNQLITAETYIGKHVFHTNFFARYGTKAVFVMVFLLFLSLASLYIALTFLNRRGNNS